MVEHRRLPYPLSVEDRRSLWGGGLGISRVRYLLRVGRWTFYLAEIVSPVSRPSIKNGNLSVIEEIHDRRFVASVVRSFKVEHKEKVY